MAALTRFRVLRLWNNDVLARSESVSEAILAALESVETGVEPAPPLSPLLDPPPQGGREQTVE
ncbi:hypothetical protein [Sphingomonas sp. DT-204]|uniref:hypothetical protein n=1 Tax=Sphingomonas sp. DT-204 TaxID=3396166 RepID=UPI003F1CE7B2